jgi:two-component system NarL family response regulator
MNGPPATPPPGHPSGPAAAAAAAAPAAPIRVLVVDDHPVVRDGIAAVLDFQPDITVAGRAGDGEEAVRLFRALLPDVTLMDLGLPGMDGVEAIAAIRGEVAGARIVVLTTYDGDESIHRALAGGARGYLLKDCTTAELLAAVRTVAAGGNHVSPAAASRLAQRAAAGPGLSRREIEVLRAVAAGRTNREIGALLGIGEGTVKTHVLRIYDKLGVRDRTEAVLTAMRRGIVRLD